MNYLATSTFVIASLFATSTAVAGLGPETDPQTTIEASSQEPSFDLNINANPFYLLFGGAHVAASFRLDQENAIGPIVSTMSFLGSRLMTIGVQGQHSLRGQDVMSEGLIIDSSIEFLSYSFDFFGQTETHRALMAHASVDWQWFYNNGFNMRIGLGLAAQMGLGDGTLDYSGVSGAGATNLGDSFAAHGFLDADVAWAF